MGFPPKMNKMESVVYFKESLHLQVDLMKIRIRCIQDSTGMLKSNKSTLEGFFKLQRGLNSMKLVIFSSGPPKGQAAELVKKLDGALKRTEKEINGIFEEQEKIRNNLMNMEAVLDAVENQIAEARRRIVDFEMF